MNVIQSLAAAAASLALGLACTPQFAERFDLERAFAVFEHSATLAEARLMTLEAPEPPELPDVPEAPPAPVYVFAFEQASESEGGAKFAPAVEAIAPADYAAIDEAAVIWQEAAAELRVAVETQCVAQRMRSPL